MTANWYYFLTSRHALSMASLYSDFLSGEWYPAPVHRGKNMESLFKAMFRTLGTCQAVIMPTFYANVYAWCTTKSVNMQSSVICSTYTCVQAPLGCNCPPRYFYIIYIFFSSSYKRCVILMMIIP